RSPPCWAARAGSWRGSTRSIAHSRGLIGTSGCWLTADSPTPEARALAADLHAMSDDAFGLRRGDHRLAWRRVDSVTNPADDPRAAVHRSFIGRLIPREMEEVVRCAVTSTASRRSDAATAGPSRCGRWGLAPRALRR